MAITTTPLKRPSAGGRLRRLLASLRPPARPGGPLPVQTGFPTSLADLVVKNHDRLKKPRRAPSPETKQELDSRGRGLVSPIREAAESPAETPRPSSVASSDTGSEVSASLLAADTTDIAGGDDPDSISPSSKRKEKRRSLRKLLAKKLQNGKRPKEVKDSRRGSESEHPPVAGEVSAVEAAPAEETTPPPEREAVADERRRRRRGGALPLAAFVPLVLVGLMAGKLPAVALTVLCAVFFTSVERVPDAVARASGHGSDPR